MRRALAIVALAVGLPVLLVVSPGFAGDGDSYEVRAIFPNGGFLVAGEDVRIAGANVGQIAEVDVTGTDEAVHADGSPEPGKAVVVLEIDDPGFQDFREDAFCFIRPQSLLGERFVECQPTQPRASGTEPPPPLEVIADGEPGAGQYLLPIENTGKPVDLDLVNNIMRAPAPDQFRLILNDLGAGLAARGDDLEAIVRRANPALMQTDRVLATLAKQNRVLANLARDGARSLGPLARERSHLQGFINNANATAQATAERSDDLEASIQKLPAFLRELESNMAGLDRFADAATPTVSALGDAAPGITRATVALGPFARAATPALTSLGDAAEEAQPDLIASDPVIRQLGRLGKTGEPVGRNIKKLLGSLRATGGYQGLLRFIFNSAGAANGYDASGHYLRAVLTPNSCTHYNEGGQVACVSRFDGAAQIQKAKAKRVDGATRSVGRALETLLGGFTSPPEPGETPDDEDGSDAEEAPTTTVPSTTVPAPDADRDAGTSADAKGTGMRDMRLLMRYFLGGEG